MDTAHVVIEAIFHQNSKSKYYRLLADIISEYMDNTAYQNGFFSMEAESIQAAFFDFTDKKEWNNVACDTIPLIISKIINKNIIVIEPIESIEEDDEPIEDDQTPLQRIAIAKDMDEINSEIEKKKLNKNKNEH